MKINLLESEYTKEGVFNNEKAMLKAGRSAGICYSQDDFEKMNDEDKLITLKRANFNLKSGHHSVYGHVPVSLEIIEIPKIMAMILNNEKEYNTSEKSGRYTNLSLNSNEEELSLYNKWEKIFEEEIEKEYGEVFKSSKIKKLAMENARYLLSIYTKTSMVYTTNIRQLNYIANFMMDEIENPSNEYFANLREDMIEFVENLDNKKLLIEGLNTRDKKRKLSLFKPLRDKHFSITPYDGTVYDASYEASFAYLGQAQRHRSLDYSMSDIEESYFVPPILNDDLKQMWIEDLHKLKDIKPQGTKIMVNENGTYDMFILKTKERLCAAAQLEINNITKELLIEYKNQLKEINNYLYEDIENYNKGARCTFSDFACLSPCTFKEGKTLTRRI